MPSEKSELPLESEAFVREDERVGCRVKLTSHRRGVLRGEAICYPIDKWFEANSEAQRLKRAREKFDQLCEVCRDRLEELGLPSDRIYDGFKKARAEGRTPSADDIKKFESMWVLPAWRQTKPLSVGRCAADLLWSLNHLLVRDELEKQLPLIFDCMLQFYQFCVALDVNKLATSGLAANAARRAGPKARKTRALAKQQIICAQAKEFWAHNPLYRNDATNTADLILAPVNEEFERRGLLPKSGKQMSKKRIADHIREGLCGNKIKIGQSGNATR